MYGRQSVTWFVLSAAHQARSVPGPAVGRIHAVGGIRVVPTHDSGARCASWRCIAPGTLR